MHYKKTSTIQRLFITFSSVMFLYLLTACTVFQGRESMGSYVDDTTITTEVKHAILTEKKLKFFQISVETFRGDVQLSGFVDNKEEANIAGNIASRVKGVRSVKNNLIIRGHSSRVSY